MKKEIEIILLLTDCCKILNALLSDKKLTEGEMIIHKSVEEKIDKANRIIRTI